MVSFSSRTIVPRREVTDDNLFSDDSHLADTVVIKMVASYYSKRARSDAYNWAMIGKRRALRGYGDTVEDAFRAYFSVIGVEGGALLAKQLADLPPLELSKLTKDITTAMKMRRPRRFKFFCDLGTLVGYPSKESRAPADDVSAWLENRTEDNTDVDTYVAAMAQVLRNALKPPEFTCEFEEYVTQYRHLWATDGSSSESKLYRDGELVRTKAGTALSLSDQELLHLVNKQQPMRVFIKPDERDLKTRYIVSAPLPMYLKQKYLLDMLMFRLNTNDTILAAYWSDWKQLDFAVRTLRSMPGYVQYPLDESSFDFQVSEKQWKAFFKLGRTLFPHSLWDEWESWLGTYPVEFDDSPHMEEGYAKRVCSDGIL